MWILFLLIAIAVVEGLSRAYEFSSPLCIYLESDVFDDVNYFEKREVCNAETLVRYNQTPIVHYIPDQRFPTLNINSDGFRGGEIKMEKEDGITRIFVVGGSTTFGIGATSDKTTIPGQLQKKIDEKFHGNHSIEVINAGINGAESSRITYLIEHKLINYSPDLIIIYDGINDSMRHWEDKEDDPYFNVPLILDKEGTGGEGVFFELKNIPFYRTPFVINKLLIDYPELKFEKSVDSVYHYPEIAEIWAKRHNHSCELGKENNFKVVVILQPSLGSGDKPYSKGELEYIKNSRFIEGIQQNFQSMSEKLEILELSCSKVVDMRNIFDGISEPVFIDYGHTSDFGNEIVSENMLEEILPILDKNY